MKRLFTYGLPALLLAAAASSPAAMAQSYLPKDLTAGPEVPACAETFRQARAEINQAGRTVDEAGILPLREDGGQDDVVGYVAWIGMTECQGDVFIEMNRDCGVTDVYTQGTCPLPRRQLTN